MAVEIRKMRSDDMGQVLALLARWNMAPVEPTPGCPEPERSSIEVANAFVAVDGEVVVGVAGYIMLSEEAAETASLAVDQEWRGSGVGYRLQQARLEEMRRRGVKTVRTEADRPETIKWYVEKFGYCIVGRNPKKHSFSLPDVDHWTVLQLDIGTDGT